MNILKNFLLSFIPVGIAYLSISFVYLTYHYEEWAILGRAIFAFGSFIIVFAMVGILEEGDELKVLNKNLQERVADLTKEIDELCEELDDQDEQIKKLKGE